MKKLVPGLAAGVLLLGGQVVVQLGTAEPAAAQVSAQVTEDILSAIGSERIKTAEAVCPPGTRVTGGGVYMIDSGFMVLPIAMYPSHPTDGGNDSFVVVASEPRGPNGEDVYAEDWAMEVSAICVSGLTGVEIVSNHTTAAGLFKEVDARCSPGKLVLGVGASIDSDSAGHVGLHLVRPDGYLIEGRASARRKDDSFGLAWTLNSYAVCADPIGQQGVGVLPARTANRGDVYCPAGMQLVGIGGGGSVFEDGPADIHDFVPTPDLSGRITGSEVHMTAAPNSGMVVTAVCAP